MGVRTKAGVTLSTFVIGVLRLLLGRVHSGCFLRYFEWSLSDPFRTF